MRKEVVFPIFMLLLCQLLALCALAASDGFLTVEIANAPDNAELCDILVKLDESDASYVSADGRGEAFTLSGDCGLANYHADGYVSLFFHYAGKQSSIGLYRREVGDIKQYAAFCGTTYGSEEWLKYQRLLNEFKTVRIALTDLEGDILYVSGDIDLTNKLYTDSSGEIILDVEAGSAYLKRTFNLLKLLADVIPFIICLILRKFIYRKLLNVKANTLISALIFAVAFTLFTVIKASPLLVFPLITVTFAAAEAAVLVIVRKHSLKKSAACALLCAVATALLAVW